MVMKMMLMMMTLMTVMVLMMMMRKRMVMLYLLYWLAALWGLSCRVDLNFPSSGAKPLDERGRRHLIVKFKKMSPKVKQKNLNSQGQSSHCTMLLSIELEISEICKSKAPVFAQFRSKIIRTSFDGCKTVKRSREKYFLQILLKKNINHSIALKNWPSLWSNLGPKLSKNWSFTFTNFWNL